MSSKCLQEQCGYFWIHLKTYLIWVWNYTLCTWCQEPRGSARPMGLIPRPSHCQLNSQLQSCFSQLLKHSFSFKHLVSPILCHEARKVLGITYAPDQLNGSWNSSRSMWNRALPYSQAIWQLTSYLKLLKYSRMWNLKAREGECMTMYIWSHHWLRNNSEDFSVLLLLSRIFTLFLSLSFDWKNMFEPSGCRSTRGCFRSRFWVMADSQRHFLHPAGASLRPFRCHLATTWVSHLFVKCDSMNSGYNFKVRNSQSWALPHVCYRCFFLEVLFPQDWKGFSHQICKQWLAALIL